jgi:WD40 repeat protein
MSSHERLTLIDVATGKRMREIAPKVESRSVMLTPDRRTAVLFGHEHNFREAELRDIATVQRFDLVSGKMLSKFPVNDHFGEAIAIAPDGRTACTGADSGMLSVWDLFTGKVLTSHKLGNALVNAVTISADGELLIAGTTEGLYFWKRSERLAGKAPIQIDEGRSVQAMPA